MTPPLWLALAPLVIAAPSLAAGSALGLVWLAALLTHSTLRTGRAPDWRLDLLCTGSAVAVAGRLLQTALPALHTAAGPTALALVAAPALLAVRLDSPQISARGAAVGALLLTTAGGLRELLALGRLGGLPVFPDGLPGLTVAALPAGALIGLALWAALQQHRRPRPPTAAATPPDPE